VSSSPPAAALDLGSGGGVPGLVLADVWPESRWVLVDSDSRRVGFLDTAVIDLGWGKRVTVVHGRAEDAARETRFRGQFDLVTARSFGAPAVTAECGAPFLRVGGELIVSDPPTGAQERWPATGLAILGLVVREHTTEIPHLTVLRQEAACPDRFPRVPSALAKRPLF
jgi:16S rRNA (guanine527-N7)-methyltransferase